MKSKKIAPAHSVLTCAGVFIVCLLVGSACDKGPAIKSNDRTLEIAGDTIDLPRGVALHDVKVHATGRADFEPAQVTAKAGDAVRFTISDRRTHALVITAPSSAAQQTLEATSQRRSPPLVSAGQVWVVSLKGLPAGTYDVSCLSHAGTAQIVVQ